MPTPQVRERLLCRHTDQIAPAQDGQIVERRDDEPERQPAEPCGSLPRNAGTQIRATLPSDEPALTRRVARELQVIDRGRSARSAMGWDDVSMIDLRRGCCRTLATAPSQRLRLRANESARCAKAGSQSAPGAYMPILAQIRSERMETSHFLQDVVMFLARRGVAVSLSKRWGLGAVLGYLAAGALIGPYVLNLAPDMQQATSQALRVRRDPAVVRHRPGAVAAAPVADAPGGVRRRPARRSCCPALLLGGAALAFGTRLEERAGDRPRAGAVVDRDRPADSRRAQAARTARTGAWRSRSCCSRIWPRFRSSRWCRCSVRTTRPMRAARPGWPCCASSA